MVYKKYIKEICKFIDDNQKTFMKDLNELLSIPSVSDNLPEVRRALHWCIDKAKSYGLKAEAILDDQIGIIEMGEGDETLGMLAHVDVVSAGDESEWTYPPYAATLSDDGFVWGRGSADNKGPLLNCLYAMLAVKNLELPINKKVQLILGTQEEVAWTDMNAYVSSCKLPDYSFTPDGAFPIGNREKGVTNIKLSFKKRNVNKGEFEITKLYGGPTMNSVPNDAYVLLKGNMEDAKNALDIYYKEHPENTISITLEGELICVRARGVSAHASTPENGVNAIWLLVDFIGQLDLADNGADNTIKFINEIVQGDFDGVPFGLDRGDVYVNGEYMHKTTMVLSMMDVEDDAFNLYYDIRQTYGISKSDIEEGFNLHSEKYQYSVTVIDFMDALYVSSNRPHIKLMEEVYNNNTEWTNDFVLGYGTSYAKALPNTVYWGPVFPDEVDYSHETDERVKYSNLILATKIFSYYVAEIVLNEESFLYEEIE